MDTKPTALPVKLGNIPQSLKSMDCWVMWAYTKRKNKNTGEEKWAKVPYQIDGKPASSTNSATWCSFSEAADALVMSDIEFDGIGFMLGAEVQGIDLDDCITDGQMSALAIETLQRVQGYAEVSPSGTGLKIFSRTNLDGGRADKNQGVELYREGRYFTVTGCLVDDKHGDLPDETQDLDWLVDKVWGEKMSAVAMTTDKEELELLLYKSPLEGWDADRIMLEIAPHLDLDMHYEDWIKVGQALYHQFDGDIEGFELWDSIFHDSPKYGGSDYGWERWRSFKTHRPSGRGPVTLASVLHMVKDKRQVAKLQKRDEIMAEVLKSIEDTTDPRELQEKVAARVAHESELSDVEREQVAAAIQSRGRALGVKIEISTVRGWVRSRVKGSGGFVHLNDEGHPLCTLENFRALLERLQWVIRYNVIKKAIEILIPGAEFTRDNRDNAALACVLSECEKVRMPTKHVAQYLIKIADENQYNPVGTWLLSKPWDGTSRLEDFFDTVQSPSTLKKKLMRKWLLQSVAAAMSPDGIAGQGILVFVGPQNIGKTTWFQRLAPNDLDVILTGHTLDLKSKDSTFIALTYWIVELGELDATFKKSEVSAMKAFVTQPVDKLRRPYAATESSFGRRTVFGGSVNEEQFLNDATGNRRYFTIPVTGFSFNHGIDMQQLWAEVLHLWQGGEAYYLTMDEVGELNEHNESFLTVDPIDERVAGGYDWLGKVEKWDWVTASEALIRVGVREPTKTQTITASAALRRLNGGQRRRANGKTLFAVPSGAEEFPD